MSKIELLIFFVLAVFVNVSIGSNDVDSENSTSCILGILKVH
jgi:hypothetical protein